MTQEFINVATRHFVDHLLSNIGPDEILANTADIAFHTPGRLLCQSTTIAQPINDNKCQMGTLTDNCWIPPDRLRLGEVLGRCSDVQEDEK